MSKPSSLTTTQGLTRNFNTEQVIAGIANVCVGRGDMWQGVAVHEIETWGGSLKMIPWDRDAAVQAWDLNAWSEVDRATQQDVHAALLDRSTTGRFIALAVKDGWVRLLEVGAPGVGVLGAELTEYALGRMTELRYVS